MTKEVKTLFVSTTEPAVLVFSTVTDGKSKFSDEPSYDVIVEFAPDSADLKNIRTQAAGLASENWPGIDLKPLQKFWKAGKAKDGTPTGKIICTARSDYQPTLSVLENGKLRELTSPVDLKQYRKWFFGGAEVLVGITLRPYEVKGDKGISAKLGMVLSVKPSASGGGRDAAEVFKGYVGTVSTEDPGGFSADLDDEIPF